MSIYDVFLSYRRSDGAGLARKIRDYLVEKGLRVFFDTEEMVDGLYFTTQIVDNLRQAPNYILVATQDVFNFREGEDWVREEIAHALSEYEADSTNRTVNVIVPSGVVFPNQSDLPESVRNIAVPNRICLAANEPTYEEYLRLLKAVSGVNRRNLWNAGHRWLENSKKEGARFAALSIDETIMPKAKKHIKKEPEHNRMPILVYQKEKSEDGYEHHTDDQQLLDALSSTQGHLYLIGEGGIGKTTSLIRIMNEAYSGRQYTENAQIPLFIELSRAPDTYGRLYEGGVSTFIRRAIYQQIRADRSVKQVSAQAAGQVGDAFSVDPELAVVPVDGLLTAETPAPEYLLLLDGLNETSRTEIDDAGRSVVQMIMQEIEWIIENCSNVRVMLTSRTDETALRNEKITRLYLTGVDNNTIRGYLESCRLPKKRIDAVFENERLLETLRIPLFLTMYASLKGNDEVTSRGGIFRMFFSERRENLDIYTAQSRIASVDADVANAASKHNSARIDAKMQNFMLDFLLPEIAWHMERNGLFYMDIDDISDIIERVLTDTSDIAACGRYGKKLFTKYRNGADSSMHTLRVAKSMINKLSDDFEESAEAVVNCCTLQLGVMQESNGQYGFMHHHIRDYFAAVREVNSLRLAVYAFEQGKGDIARECLVGMKETPIHIEISRFIGEYLEEDKNAPSFADGKWKYNVPDKVCDRNLIKRALDIFRGRFDGEDGYAVYSLIEVLKNVRKDLSGANLSRLDLTQCTLNGVELGRTGIGADFTWAKMGRYTVMPAVHSGPVHCAALSSDGKYAASCSVDGVKIWNAETGVMISHIMTNHSTCIAFSPDGRYILTDSGCNVILFEWESKKLVAKLPGHSDFIDDVAFSISKYIATASRDNTVRIWDISGKLLVVLSGHSDHVRNISFSLDEKHIATASDDGTAKIWSVTTGELLYTLEGHEGAVYEVQFSADGSYVATASSDLTAKIWNAETGKLLNTLDGCLSKSSSASFSPDAKQLITGTSDKKIKIWDVKTGAILDTVIDFNETVRNVAFSQDGKRIITSERGGYVSGGTYLLKIWNAHSKSLLCIINGYSHMLENAEYSPDNSQLMIAGRNRIINFWDVYTMQLNKMIDVGANDIYTSQYSIDGRYIFTASSDNMVRVWKSDSGAFVNEFKIEPQKNRPQKSVSLCRNMIAVVSRGNNNCKIRIFDIPSGKLLTVLNDCVSKIEEIVFSPDGKYITSISFDNTAKIWNISSGALYKSLSVVYDSAKCVCFSSDSRYLATASSTEGKTLVGRKSILIWDLHTGELLNTIIPQQDVLCGMSFIQRGGCTLLSVCTTFSISKKPDRNERFSSLVEIDISTGNACNKFIVGGCRNPRWTYNFQHDKVAICDAMGRVDLYNLLTLEPRKISVNNTALRGTTHITFNPDGSRLTVVTSSGDTIIIDTETGDIIDTIPNVPGLMVIGCDLRNLHPDSNFSDEDRDILRRYGAIID